MHVVLVLLALAWQGGDAAAHLHMDEAHSHEGHEHDAPASAVAAAEDEFEAAPPPRRSYLLWLYLALGPRYTLAFMLLTPTLLLGTLVLVAWSKHPGPIAAFFPLLALPLLVGCIGFFDGMISALVVIAGSYLSPKPSEIAAGVSTALVTPLVALVLTLPMYLILSIGLLVRSLAHHNHGK